MPPWLTLPKPFGSNSSAPSFRRKPKRRESMGSSRTGISLPSIFSQMAWTLPPVGNHRPLPAMCSMASGSPSRFFSTSVTNSAAFRSRSSVVDSGGWHAHLRAEIASSDAPQMP